MNPVVVVSVRPSGRHAQTSVKPGSPITPEDSAFRSSGSWAETVYPAVRGADWPS